MESFAVNYRIELICPLCDSPPPLAENLEPQPMVSRFGQSLDQSLKSRLSITDPPDRPLGTAIVMVSQLVGAEAEIAVGGLYTGFPVLNQH